MIEIIEARNSKRLNTPRPYLTQLRKTVNGGRKEQARRFKSIMSVAKQTYRENPAGLQGLIGLLGRTVQARAMSTWITRGDGFDFHFWPDAVMFSSGVPITKKNASLDDLKREVAFPGTISLERDIVLPWPWKAERVVSSLSNLRPGGNWGPWKQDDNHRVEVWLPMRLGWVYGGNHSITAGIVYGAGEIRPGCCFDVSDVYKHVRCDGLSYLRIHDKTVIAPVSDLEFAAIFEIGRLLKNARNSV